MSDLPAPLTPSDCDLRNYPHMYLDVIRLRDSSLARKDGEVFRAAVLSWCAAWHQVPAGSLPDDDEELAGLLGFGRDIKGWRKLRAAGGLHGYIKCSDGRLYHPVVAEKVNDAWQKSRAQRDRTEAARKARLSQRLSQTDPPSVTDNVTDCATPSVTDSKREEKRREEKVAAAQARGRAGANGSGPPRWDDAAIVPEPSDHRPTVNGWYLDYTFDAALEAANIDPARTPVTWKPVVSWLKANIEPEVIVAAIRRCAERDGYEPPSTLAYFDKPVRQGRVH